MPKQKANPYSHLMLSRIGRISRFTNKVLDKFLAPAHITLQEFKIVGLLLGEPKLSQKALASKMSVKPATLSVAIDKLEAKGVIQRETSATDKRVNYLSICPTAEYDNIDEIISTIEQLMTKGIKKSELEIAKRVIATMGENLEKELNRSTN